ncbi:MAG TPA: hypothetical protein VMW72_23160 [Sedimentisphaerales bacterium]|nr:hypothetical protein [Sedimentisphaerales bacterium]
MKPPSKPFKRTVYVLGAGFSREANVPLQSEILEAIRNLNLSDAPASLVNRYLTAWNNASTFLRNVFGLKTDPLLEDAFTLLDETISQKQYCCGYSWQTLETINKSLNEVILYLFHLKQKGITNNAREFYNSFAAYCLEVFLKSQKSMEPISIISLNWDCVLDNAFNWCLSKCVNIKTVVDYACYCTAIPESEKRIYFQDSKYSNFKKFKLMKLHGSTNWSLCPNCGRVYTGLGMQENIWIKYILGTTCPKCSNFIPSSEGQEIRPPILESFLITPTFVKKFENPHIQMVWHIAYTELCEAERVVFIGYSLREADYRLRTLFKRAIRAGTDIEVVLAPCDKPKKKYQREKNIDGVTGRYKQFFRSSDPMTFFYGGVKKYFQKNAGSVTLKTRIRRLQRLAKE